MAQDATPTPTTTADVSNAKQLNQAVSTVISNLGTNAAAVVTALGDIATAVTNSLIGGTTGATANRALISKGTTGRALQPSPVSINASTGNINTNGGDLTVHDITANAVTADAGAFATTLTKGGTNVAIVTQTVGCSFTFKAPENETVALILNAAFSWTITQTNTITEVGTSTVSVKIGTTTLGGGSNSASTSLNTVTHSSSNAVAATNQINVTFASTSSDCENLCLTIWGTRTLAS